MRKTWEELQDEFDESKRAVEDARAEINSITSRGGFDWDDEDDYADYCRADDVLSDRYLEFQGAALRLINRPGR